jgi:hypothetical protein
MKSKRVYQTERAIKAWRNNEQKDLNMSDNKNPDIDNKKPLNLKG